MDVNYVEKNTEVEEAWIQQAVTIVPSQASTNATVSDPSTLFVLAAQASVPEPKVELMGNAEPVTDSNSQSSSIAAPAPGATQELTRTTS